MKPEYINDYPYALTYVCGQCKRNFKIEPGEYIGCKPCDDFDKVQAGKPTLGEK